jgi:hypothetical protein
VEIAREVKKSYNRKGQGWQFFLLLGVEIALPFGKQIVREKRCSCKAKSRGKKKASGGLVVATGAGLSALSADRQATGRPQAGVSPASAVVAGSSFSR